MLLYTHPACLAHDPGAGHPESPARLRAVLEALDDPRFGGLDRRDAPRATREQLARVHGRELIDAIHAASPNAGYAQLDADTTMSPDSLEAALRAAGAACAAVDALIDGEDTRAFCAVRPPGHHATRDTAMGFCLFNNVAAGAAQALARGIERVAMLRHQVGGYDGRLRPAGMRERPLHVGHRVLSREEGVRSTRRNDLTPRSRCHWT